jgi:hypothetical protein
MNEAELKQRFMTMAALTDMVTADNIHDFMLARSLVDGVIILNCSGHFSLFAKNRTPLQTALSLRSFGLPAGRRHLPDRLADAQ